MSRERITQLSSFAYPCESYVSIGRSEAKLEIRPVNLVAGRHDLSCGSPVPAGWQCNGETDLESMSCHGFTCEAQPLLTLTLCVVV
jgi:hypothetical protein